MTVKDDFREIWPEATQDNPVYLEYDGTVVRSITVHDIKPPGDPTILLRHVVRGGDHISLTTPDLYGDDCEVIIRRLPCSPGARP